jgi:hypothetical protein
MKTFKKVWACLFVFLFVIAVTGWAFALEEQKEEQKKVQEMSQEEQVKLFQRLASPSENHKHLAYFVGNWDSVQKMFPGPGIEPVIRKQGIEVKSLYDGRFTQARIWFVEKIFGMDIEGIVITGYDNYKQTFNSVTFGNMGTDFSYMTGTLDPTGKIRTDYGETDDVFNGTKVKVKAITTIIDPDKYTYEYFHIDDKNNEVKIMEIAYFRKK